MGKSSEETSFCTKCGAEIIESSNFCSKCGESKIKSSGIKDEESEKKEPRRTFQRPPEWKSEGVTLVLTIVLGIFGFGGIGHIYLGRVLRGITILIVGIILLVIAIVTFGIGLIALIPFAIWVILDARKLCKEYNNHLEQTGKPPW